MYHNPESMHFKKNKICCVNYDSNNIMCACVRACVSVGYCVRACMNLCVSLNTTQKNVFLSSPVCKWNEGLHGSCIRRTPRCLISHLPEPPTQSSIMLYSGVTRMHRVSTDTATGANRPGSHQVKQTDHALSKLLARGRRWANTRHNSINVSSTLRHDPSRYA